jgi:hypothetical protein
MPDHVKKGENAALAAVVTILGMLLLRARDAPTHEG